MKIEFEATEEVAKILENLIDKDKYVEFCYDLSISQLMDADRPRFVRGYFGLD